MSRTSTSLARCFQSVFPEMDDVSVRSASIETVVEWDSLSSLTLLGVIEEEFGVQIPMDELPRLRSFGALEVYLRQMHGLD